MLKIISLLSLTLVLQLNAKLLLDEDNSFSNEEPEFYSIGTLPEGYTFVCIKKQKWLQYKTDSETVLTQMFIEDEETGDKIPQECL